MSDINTVLERLITDPGFRQQIKEDPKAALTPYDLNEADLELLANQISDEKGSESAVETRTSKSALAGLLGLFGGGGSAQTQPAETDLDFVSRGSAPEPSDGVVDGQDFLVWQRSFGDDAGGGSEEFSLEDTPGGEQAPEAHLKNTDEPSAHAIELENAQIASYEIGAVGDESDVGDEIVGDADNQTADDPHKDEIDVLSYAWGETNDLAPEGEGPDDLTVPEETSDASVGGDQSETVGSNRSDPVGISEIRDGTSNTMALGEVAEGDPDQPVIVGSVPNDASDPGLQSDGELVQAVSEDDPGRSDDLTGPETEPEKEIEGTDVSTGSYVGAEPIGDELPEDPPTDD